MFYIIDKFSDFVRTHPRLGYPQGLTCENARDYADKFKTKAEAETQLAYWQMNNEFEGKVISHRQSCDIVVYVE